MGPRDGISRNWAIKFVGAGGSGSNARRAKKAMQALRKNDGEWEKLHAEIPTGASTQVFVSPDKSPKQRKTDIAAKRLLKVFQK
eukprot:3405289-Karenia_brevis.AAC.1